MEKTHEVGWRPFMPASTLSGRSVALLRVRLDDCTPSEGQLISHGNCARSLFCHHLGCIRRCITIIKITELRHERPKRMRTLRQASRQFSPTLEKAIKCYEAEILCFLRLYTCCDPVASPSYKRPCGRDSLRG